MKLINKNAIPLKVKAVENLEDVHISEYNKNAWLAQINENNYIIIKRQFTNNANSSFDKTVNLNNATCEIQNLKNNDDLKLEVNYGTEDSFIVDMNGIDNFRFAKSLIFNDCDIRKIVKKLGLLDENKKYFRFGCSGSRENDFHPGGEVFESCLINGKDGSGISQSISGYLPENEEYSKSISLFDKDKEFLREERIVYSHTAFLEECKLEDSKCICIKITPKENQTSLLDILYELAQYLKLSSYSIQMYIQTNNTEENKTMIKGRVLRHMPTKPFDVLQDATDIGLEQLFELDNTDVMYGVGTNYSRYEPEWKEFTGGRQYERRGHIHATVIGKSEKKKHEVFHLRDVFVSPISNIQIVFTPIKDIYRIYSVYQKGDKFYCKSTDKDIDVLIENINNLEI